jgi:hypothetical protein
VKYQEDETGGVCNSHWDEISEDYKMLLNQEKRPLGVRERILLKYMEK